jgi:hypothetical protein
VLRTKGKFTQKSLNYTLAHSLGDEVLAFREKEWAQPAYLLDPVNIP